MATTKVSTKLLETVGVAEGGTGAVNAGAARTSLGLVIGTNVLAPNGSAASLTNLPAAGASDAEKTNIILNAFRIAVAGGISVQNMVDGVVDEFEDATGVDASTSTNETYDATSDFYTSNPTVTTAGSVSEYTGHSSIVWTNDGFSIANDQATRANDTYTGDIQLTFVVTTKAYLRAGFYVASEDSTFSNSSNRGGMSSMTNSWYWDFSDGTIMHGVYTNVQATQTIVDGDTIKIERIGSTVKFYKNASLQHTFSQTSSADLRIVFASGTGGVTSSILMTDIGSTVNMTLFSNATTALAAPDDANIVIWQQDVTAITLNTDLKAYASRNNGSTYTQITLAEVASPTTGRILTGTVDISGQSSGTAMKYKIETLNTKEQKIHAVALQWS